MKQFLSTNKSSFYLGKWFFFHKKNGWMSFWILCIIQSLASSQYPPLPPHIMHTWYTSSHESMTTLSIYIVPCYFRGVYYGKVDMKTITMMTGSNELKTYVGLNEHRETLLFVTTNGLMWTLQHQVPISFFQHINSQYIYTEVYIVQNNYNQWDVTCINMKTWLTYITMIW